MKSFGLLAFAVCVVFVSAGNDDEPTECDEGVSQMLMNGNAAFTGKFLYESMKSKPNENKIMSTYSVLQPIAQLALYAQGRTLQQLLTALKIPNKFNIRCVFPPLISSLKDEKDVVLNVASKIFATDAYPLSQDFAKDGKLVFGADPESLDFNNAQAAADRINQWVEDKTNKRIKDLAKPDMFDSHTRLVLANAIYFLGNWAIPFLDFATRDQTFHMNNEETVQVPFMYNSDQFKYGEVSDLDCKVLEMPYKGGQFSFVALLPNKIDGLSGMLEKLQDPNKFYHAYHNTEQHEVVVNMPKMKIESEFDLEPIMKSVGITDILDEQRSNLTGILKSYVPLYVSTAVHKAFVEIDEKGTEAAAATLFAVAQPVSAILNAPPVKYFKADRPFAFYILYQKHILFSGAYVKK